MIKSRAFINILLFIFFWVLPCSIKLQANEPDELEEGWNIYIDNGNTLEALELFKKAYNKSPDKMKVASSYSQLLLQVGKYEEAAKILINAFRSCKWDKWCEPAIADLMSITEYLPSTLDLIEVFEARLNNTEITWIEKTLISDSLAKLMLENQEFDNAKILYKDNNFVKDWMVLGPFSNRNQQEFLASKKFEEEIDVIDLNKTWQGRGRLLNWQKVTSPNNGTLDLGMVLYPSEESMGYVMCYIESEDVSHAVFAVEQSGASAMWVNGELKYVDSVYVKNSSALQRLIGVDLKKGVNQVVFKLAAGKDVLPKIRLQVLYGTVAQMSEISSSAFVDNNRNKFHFSVSEAFSDKYKNSNNSLKGASKMPIVKQGDSWGTAGALWGALAEFEKIVSNKAMISTYDYALALMNMGYLVNQYGFDSSEKGRERNYDTLLITQYPNCPLFLNSAAYVQIGDNPKKELLERAVKISPMEIAAREGLMILEVNTGFYDKAWKSAEKLAKDSGWSFSTYHILANISEMNGWNAEALRYYTKTLEYAHGKGWLYARRAGVSASVREAIEILQVGSKRVFDKDLAQAMGGWLYKDSQFDKANKIYEKLIQLEKYSEEYWDGYAACSVALGDYEQAIAKLKEGLTWMPQSPFLREKIGRLLLRIGERDEGLKYFHQALGIQKDNPDLIAYIEELSNSDKPFYADSEVDFAILEGKDILPSDYPQFDRVRLLHQNYVTVTENGSMKRMVRKVVKVLRDSAVKEVSTEGIFYDSSRQKVDIKHARVIQTNGEINENPVIEDGMYNSGFKTGGIYDSAQVRSIKFLNVKEGSIIDIMYTIEDTQANIYHDEFSDIQFFGEIEPTIKFMYTAVVPKKMGVESYVNGVNKKIVVKDIENNMVEIRLEIDNVAGIAIEPMMPPIEEIKPFIAVSTFKDWSDLSKWAYGLFEPEIILPNDIKSIVHDIVKDAKNIDEKIAAIYNYVTKNIRYVSISYGRFGYVPHKAERTFRSGYGDCKDTAVLLSAMLHEVGIKAYPTLVRTRDKGPLLSKLACPELFNHSIAYVPAQEGLERHYWLDGTTDYFLLGMIPAMDRGTEALIIKSEGGLLEIDNLKPDQDIQISESKISLHKDGSGKIVGKEIYKGRSSTNLRRTFEKPEAFFSALRGFFNQKFAGVKVDHLNYKLEESKPLGWFEYNLVSEKISLEDGNALKIIPGVFPLNIGGIAILKDRNYDLVIGSPKIFEAISDIELEDGLTLMSELPDINEEIDSIAYSRTLEKINNGIRVHSKITLKKSRVSKEEYHEFRSFVNMIMARSREWVFFSK